MILRDRSSLRSRDDPLSAYGASPRFAIACLGEPMPDADFNILRESLDLLILKALTWGPKHGYAISEWIEGSTEDLLLVEEGTLYPALHRLAERGWVTSEWGQSESGRRARYYQLTRDGRAHLRNQGSVWHRYVEAIAKALRAANAEYGR